MKRALWLLLIPALSCDTGGHGPGILLKEVKLTADCQQLPKTQLVGVDPARPDEWLAEEHYSVDHGKTWKGIFDGKRGFVLHAGVTSLGNGVWYGGSRNPDTSKPDLPVAFDMTTGKATLLAFGPVTGPTGLFRSAKVKSDLFVGIDELTRLWKSADGSTWTPLDGLYRRSGIDLVVSRGDRVWRLITDSATGQQTLRVSDDQGRTFTPRQLPPGSNYDNPTLGTGKRGVLTGFPEDYGQVDVTAAVWITEDDGVTWRDALAKVPWRGMNNGAGLAYWPDDTLYITPTLNQDAAAPNPAGLYIVRSRDSGKTWERLFITVAGTRASGLEITAEPSSPEGFSFLFGKRCTAPAKGDGQDFTTQVEPAATVPPVPTLSMLPEFSQVESPLTLSGKGLPNATIYVALSGGRSVAVDHRIFPQDVVIPEQTLKAGTDGNFSGAISWSGFERGTTFSLGVFQSEGKLVSLGKHLGLKQAGTALQNATFTAPLQDEAVGSSFDLRGHTEPGSSLTAFVVSPYIPDAGSVIQPVSTADADGGFAMPITVSPYVPSGSTFQVMLHTRVDGGLVGTSLPLKRQ